MKQLINTFPVVILNFHRGSEATVSVLAMNQTVKIMWTGESVHNILGCSRMILRGSAAPSKRIKEIPTAYALTLKRPNGVSKIISISKSASKHTT